MRRVLLLIALCGCAPALPPEAAIPPPPGTRVAPSAPGTEASPTVSSAVRPWPPGPRSTDPRADLARVKSATPLLIDGNRGRFTQAGDTRVGTGGTTYDRVGGEVLGSDGTRCTVVGTATLC